MIEEDVLFRRIAGTPFDPVSGKGCAGDRVEVARPVEGGTVYVPRTMTLDGRYPGSLVSAVEFDRLRLCHDFEFWAITCCNIRDKKTGTVIPFRLNDPQRYVVEMFEEDRTAGRPLRFIMLKARQWGGSTLVQM